MRPNIKVDATSLRKTLAELQKFGKESERVISEVTQDAANDIRDKAMENARSLGIQNLVEPIGKPIVVFPQQTGEMYYTINVQGVPMAAYFEFGTGTFVEVADEWKGLAWEFYVNGKGSLQPHPFLYPAFRDVRITYQKTLEKAIDILAKRHSS